MPRRHDRSPHPTSRRYVYRPPMTPIPWTVFDRAPGEGLGLVGPGDSGTRRRRGDLGHRQRQRRGSDLRAARPLGGVDYNAFCEHTIVESELPVPKGDSTLEVSFRRTGRDTGTLAVAIDGQPCGDADLPLHDALRLHPGRQHRIRPRLPGVRNVRGPLRLLRRPAPSGNRTRPLNPPRHRHHRPHRNGPPIACCGQHRTEVRHLRR